MRINCRCNSLSSLIFLCIFPKNKNIIFHGILQARILERVAIPFSRGSAQSGGRIQVSCIAVRFLRIWATREALILYNHSSNYQNQEITTDLVLSLIYGSYSDFTMSRCSYPVGIYFTWQLDWCLGKSLKEMEFIDMFIYPSNTYWPFAMCLELCVSGGVGGGHVARGLRKDSYVDLLLKMTI